MALTNDKMLKGSTMMIFKDGASIGFATSHQLSAQLSTTQIATKDHGNYPATLPQTINWTITAENVYSDAGKNTYMDALKNHTVVNLVFAKVADPVGTQGSGIIGSADSWTPGTVIASGPAIITDLSINAPAGDYATLSVTFTGTGALTAPTT